jgi:hypothetical protein
MEPFRARCFEVVPSNRGIIVAGAPIGSPHYVSKFNMDLMDKVKAYIDRVAKICRAPVVTTGCRLYYIIRKCVMPHVNDFLRVCPPEGNAGAARMFDDMVRDRIVAILNIRKFLPHERTEESISLGGAGLVSIQESRKAAYVGSFALVASRMAEIAPEICQPQNLLKWDAYRQYAALSKSFRETLS